MGTDDTTSPVPTTPAAMSTLTVTVKADPAGAATTWTLQCDPPGGDHPDAAAACAAISAAAKPFDPVPRGAICTEIYGGPQTATITGSWQGRPVTASYRRTNGCELARWDKLGPVFQLKT